MPFVKPGDIVDAQQHLADVVRSSDNGVGDFDDSVIEFITMCPVCGDNSCGKTAVYVNGVYVHREDALKADSVDIYEADLRGE